MGLKASAEKEVCWPQGERVLWAKALLLLCHQPIHFLSRTYHNI